MRGRWPAEGGTEGASLLLFFHLTNPQLLISDRLNRPQHPIQIFEQFLRLHPKNPDASLLHPYIALPIKIQLLTRVDTAVDFNNQSSRMATKISDVRPGR